MPSRRTAIAIVLALATPIAFQYRLALTPDVLVAWSVHHHLRHTHGFEDVRKALAHRYGERTIAKGGGAWQDYGEPALPPAHSIYFLVGEYGLPFVTSVEAQVVVDQQGSVVSVYVRRTTDAM